MKLRHKTFQNNTIEIRMTNFWETVAEQQKNLYDVYSVFASIFTILTILVLHYS